MNTIEEFVESIPNDTMKRRLLLGLASAMDHPIYAFIGTDAVNFSAESDEFKSRFVMVKGDAL